MKSMRKMFSQIDNINKEVEIIKNNQSALSGIESTITNEKFHQKGSMSNLELTEEKEKESEKNQWA